jgi:uncharacterized protein (TIGR03435 family)
MPARSTALIGRQVRSGHGQAQCVPGDTHKAVCGARTSAGRPERGEPAAARLIAFANQLQPYQLVNVPAWAETERFDVVATMTADPPRSPFGDPNDPLLMAMRLLLAERFKLVTHRDMREMDVYALVIGQTGRQAWAGAASDDAGLPAAR